MSGINFVTISFDRKSMLYRKGSSWHLVGTSSKPKAGDGKLKTNIRIKIDPQAEYQQIFKEGWRFMRDYLYVDNVIHTTVLRFHFDEVGMYWSLLFLVFCYQNTSKHVGHIPGETRSS